MKTKQSKNRVVGANLRIAFPHIFEPDNSEIGQGKFHATFLWPKSDKETTDKMLAAVSVSKQEGVKRYGPAFEKVDKHPIKDGDDYVAEKGEAKAVGFKDHYYINARTKNKPQVVDRLKEMLFNESDVPAGSFVNASFSFFPYSTGGNKGVSVALNNVQFLRCRPEDRFAKGLTADDDFEVEEEDEDVFGF